MTSAPDRGDPPPPERGWSVPPRLADTAVAGLITVASLGFALGPGLERGQERHLIGFAVALGLLSAIPVAWRRRYPIWVLWLVQAATALHLLINHDWPQSGGLAIALALYGVTVTRDRDPSRRIALTVAALNAALICVTGFADGLGSIVAGLFTCALLVGGSWVLGDNVRTRRAYLNSLIERAHRLEQEREQEAARAVYDERARIARELHDAVAHHVSAIAVTAGAAEEVAESDPARAREALRAIQSTSRDALAEMRALVGVLTPGGEAEYAPQPGLGDVDRLVAQTCTAGLPVTLRVEGTPRRLPEAVDLSAYRIVQEALTNTLKHSGGASAEVVVRYAEGTLELEVTDDGPGEGGPQQPAEAPHVGRGLIGMRERVALFHGELVAGPGPRGGFRVHARLPLAGTTA
jgi:signal transduction histidine kinase